MLTTLEEARKHPEGGFLEQQVCLGANRPEFEGRVVAVETEAEAAGLGRVWGMRALDLRCTKGM